MFMNSGSDDVAQLQTEIERIEREGDLTDLETLPTMRDKLDTMEGANSLSGILLALLTAALLGIIFVIDVLPMIAHKFTHSVYDSGEELEQDALHDARSKQAQGDYQGAIAAFQDAAVQDPMNRLPWVEISKIQREQLKDSKAAVTTLKQAIEGQEWEVNDAAFLMFRLAEIFHDDLQDGSAAKATMEQVIEQFPETRHSANARHKLQDWAQA